MEPNTARPDWGFVTVTEDLLAASHALAKLSIEFQMEARAWTRLDARAQLERMAADLTDWAQLAALESTRGDYWSRFDALTRAQAQRAVSALTLQKWWQLGEGWNAHRLHPIPQTVQTAIKGMTA